MGISGPTGLFNPVATAVSNHAVGDMVLGFGKHIGQRFRDVPEGYLVWMSRPFNTNAWILLRGVDWTTLARQEIQRRYAEGFVLSKTPAELGWDQGTPPPQEPWEGKPKGTVIDDGSTITVADLSAALAKPEVGFAPLAQQKQDVFVEVSLRAVDDAVNVLMKPFLLRVDKSKQFLEWLVALVDEAIRDGERLSAADTIYLGYRFKIDGMTKMPHVILVGVIKEPTDARPNTTEIDVRDAKSGSGASDAVASEGAAARTVAHLFDVVTRKWGEGLENARRG